MVLDNHSLPCYNDNMIITGKINSIMRQALEYYACRLFTHQLSRHIEVKVTQRKHMAEFHGLCGIEDYNVLGQPRYFEIEIRASDTLEEKLITLGHEMTHIQQFVRNELSEDMSVWRGRRVNYDEISYNEQPWEIIAEEKGKELYKDFMKSRQV